MKLRIGTRKSPLAQAQAQWVIAELKNKFPNLEIEIVQITTSGDRGLTTENLKAAFTKEIEDALLDGRVDMAVHSLKDMAAELPRGLAIGAIPMRQDPRDVWISRQHTPFKDLPGKSKIGTGAVRRQAQLRHLRPDLDLVSIRGNVDTRLRKLLEGEWDGIVLALAGLRRLGKEKLITEVLSTDLMLPAVGQGALAIETPEENPELLPYLNALDHPSSHAAARAERALLKALGGNCQTPIAAFAEVHGDQMTLKALVASPEGDRFFRNEATDHVQTAESLGRALAKALLMAGADKVLKNVG